MGAFIVAFIASRFKMRSVLIAFFSLSFLCCAFCQSDILFNYLSGGYYVSHNVVGSDTSYYCPNTQAFLTMNKSFGQNSPAIYDSNGNALFDALDFSRYINGWGQQSAFDIAHLYSVEVLQKFSSGWYCSHPEWIAIFVKVTPSDEDCVCFTPELLNTFFVEGVKIDMGSEGFVLLSSQVKVYFHNY